MKKIFLTVIGISSMLTSINAQTLLSQDFSTFTDGALVGQNGWTQIGATATNPILVTGGSVFLGALGGQDAGVALSSTVNSDNLTAVFDLSLSSATVAGDYFFAFNTAASATNFSGRVFAKSSGAGYVIGLQMGITGATPVYGTTELSFGSINTISVTYTFVAGALNDTGSVLVNGVDYTGLVTWAGTSAENANLGAISFRQGGAATSAALSIDNMEVTASAVPEPGTVALVAIGLGAILFGARRRCA